MVVRDSKTSDAQFIVESLCRCWGAVIIGSRGKIKDASHFPALIAEDESGKAQGLLTYEINGDELEVVTLDAFTRHNGIGTMLLDSACQIATTKGLKRVVLSTSNDNVDALRFYQRRGFRITRVLRDTIQELRKHKPSIPLVGEYGIEIRDEIELERWVG